MIYVHLEILNDVSQLFLMFRILENYGIFCSDG